MRRGLAASRWAAARAMARIGMVVLDVELQPAAGIGDGEVDGVPKLTRVGRFGTGEGEDRAQLGRRRHSGIRR